MSMSHILLVEDDPCVAEVLRLFLRALGHSVTLYGSFEAGRAALGGEAPALVISDDRLGDGRGVTLVGEARRVWPGVPCILLTAGLASEVGSLPEGVLLRHKPWDVADCEATVGRLLRGG